MPEIKFHEAILQATDQSMAHNSQVYLIGLGATDPKGIFGTTLGLEEKYGSERVMDMPISENAMTGIGIGSAIVGMRPIMTHQRVDFFLLALDQLINNAAKWHYTFGGALSVPLVIRLVIGRGWGQGPQHSQSLHSFFAHIPGLKVVMPSNPYDAKGLLIAAIEDNNPVVFLEHRWLHHIYGEVPQEMYRVPIGKAKIVLEGDDVTIIASSHMTIEAIRAAQLLKEEGVSVEIVDLRSIKPLDKATILESVSKTGRVLIADDDWKTCGYAAEICSLVVEEAFDKLKEAPKRVTWPDRLCPTSWAIAKDYYPTSHDLAIQALNLLGKPIPESLLANKIVGSMDVPDPLFTGPF